jgi:hypothetical protein
MNDLPDIAAMAKEPLDPELQDWLEDSPFGRCIKHPLVYQVPMYAAGMANRQLAHKREALSRALADDDWHSYVFLHERPYRLQALIALHERGVDPEAFEKLAVSVWSDSENIWQNHDEWRQVFEWTGSGFDLDELPREELTVYRGAQEDLNEEGFSWTLDRDLAEWFARRLPRDDHPAVVITGKVHRDYVIAHVTSRGENEIVTDPDNVVFAEKERL